MVGGEKLVLVCSRLTLSLQDSSLVRESVGFEISNILGTEPLDAVTNACSSHAAVCSGHWAPRTRYVELFVIEDGKPGVKKKHYLGVYLLMEKIRKSQHRVNLDINITSMSHAECGDVGGCYIGKMDWKQEKEAHFRTGMASRSAEVRGTASY